MHLNKNYPKQRNLLDLIITDVTKFVNFKQNYLILSSTHHHLMMSNFRRLEESGYKLMWLTSIGWLHWWTCQAGGVSMQKKRRRTLGDINSRRGCVTSAASSSFVKIDDLSVNSAVYWSSRKTSSFVEINLNSNAVCSFTTADTSSSFFRFASSACKLVLQKRGTRGVSNHQYKSDQT